MFLRPILQLSVLLGLGALSACGAGVISGAIAGNQGGDSGPVAEVEPSITLPVGQGPLDIEPGQRVELAAVLSNVTVPSGSQVRVELVPTDRPDVVQVQAGVTIDQVDNPTVRWRLVTDAIRALYSDPTEQDVAVTVRLSASPEEGGGVVLGEHPFVLLRKPVATLVADDGEGVVIPVSGGLVGLEVTPQLSQSFAVEVRSEPGVTAFATVLSRFDDPVSDRTRVQLDVPAGSTPQELQLVVVDGSAGRSTRVHDVFYGPEILGITDRSGSSDGDDRTSIVGDGLIPLDFSNPDAPQPRVDRVEISFSKGGREVLLNETGLAPSSTPDALTFRTPGSPDGHPGPVSIELRVEVPRIDGSGGTRIVSDGGLGLWAYAASMPSFEPLGVAIPNSPLDIEFGPLTVAPNDARSGDAAILFRDAIDGTGLVRVLTGNEHGMLRRIGPFVQTGASGDMTVASPIDLCVGDWFDDPFLEVVVGHLGQGQFFSTSTLLRNGNARRGLLTEFEPVFDVNRNTRQLSAADIDNDGAQDVFIAAIGDAGVALSSLGSSPVWFRDMFPSQFLGGSYAVAEAIDVERDGQSEALCVVRTNREDLLTVRHIAGRLRAFGPYPLDDILGPLGRTNGVVSLGSGGQHGRIGLLVKSSSVPESDFQLFVLDLGPRDVPALRHTLSLPPEPGGEIFSVEHQVAADIDDDGRLEWVLSSNEYGIRIYEVSSTGRVELQEVVRTLGDEPIGAILSLDFAPVSPDRNALYVTHEVGFTTINETRVTTVLFGADGRSLSSKARREFDSADSVRETFTLGVDEQSVGVLTSAEFLTFTSDDFGQLTPEFRIPSGGALPQSVRSVAIGGRKGIAFLTADARIGLLFDGESSVQLSPFTLFDGVGPEVVALVDRSRIDSGDFTGDGVDDLVVLQGSSDGSGESFGLALYAGVPPAMPTVFPYEPVSFAADPELDDPTSIAVGDFELEVGPRIQEVAVALPSRGVKFFRLQQGEFRPRHLDSGNVFLSEGRSPDLVLATDLDQDGVDDVVTLSLNRSIVRVYLQQDPRFGSVNVGGFAFADDAAIPSGVRAEFFATDVDGDALDDILLSVVDMQGRPTIGALLWDGTDRLRTVFSVPAARIIGRDLTADPETRRFSFTIADTNHDDAVDIVIGWGRDDAGPSFVHTLFGSRR